MLESLTGDQRLISVLTGQWGDFGLPPRDSSFGIHALVANHYFEGGSYPVGGAARIAETIAPAIIAAGGRVLVNAEVAAIVVERGRACGVRMAADGRVIRAPLVISDAGAANTFGRLLPEDTSARIGALRAMRAVRPSIAHLCLYVGLRGTAEELGLPRANLWVYPSGNHEATFDAMQHGTDDVSFAFFSFPSAKDPDFARRHPGRSTIDIVTAVPYAPFAAWERRRWRKRGADYDALKDRLARRLLDLLYTHVPQTRGRVDCAELSTPLSTRHFANYASGELYGLDHTPERFAQRWLRPRTKVPGLFLTGQDVASCGVAGALMGGVVCASNILGTNLLAKLTAAPAAPPAAASDREADSMPSAA